MNAKARRIVVVGGGLGGLACAAELAGRGHAVTVLERGAELGGRARTTREGEFRLNYGPHALYRGGPAGALLETLGITPRGRAPAGGGLALKGERAHELPGTFGAMLRSDLFGARAKCSTVLGLVKATLADTGRWEERSLSQWAAQAVADPQARELVLALARVASYTEAPDELSAGLALRQLARVLRHGVIYLDGGWEELARAMAERARARGALLRTGARVDRIGVPDEQGRRLVHLGGERLIADELVLAVGPDACHALVPDELAFAAAARACRPVHAACLDVALRARPRGAGFALGLDRALYVSVHSDTARLSPEGGAMVHAAAYLGPDEPAPERGVLEAVLERVLPGYKEHVVHARYLPKMIVSHRLYEAAPRASYQAESAGLYAVGDWVGGPYILLDAVCDTVQAVTAAIAERETTTSLKKRVGGAASPARPHAA